MYALLYSLVTNIYSHDLPVMSLIIITIYTLDSQLINSGLTHTAPAFYMVIDKLALSEAIAVFSTIKHYHTNLME